MENIVSEAEELLLKSWDVPVSSAEKERLAALLQDDYGLRKQQDQYIKIRGLFQQNESFSFGPFFAERLIHVIKQRRENIDYQVFSFFKKYQLLIVGILVALLILNIMVADNLTFKSIFGGDSENTEDIFSIDLYKNLPE